MSRVIFDPSQFNIYTIPDKEKIFLDICFRLLSTLEENGITGLSCAIEYRSVRAEKRVSGTAFRTTSNYIIRFFYKDTPICFFLFYPLHGKVVGNSLPPGKIDKFLSTDPFERFLAFFESKLRILLARHLDQILVKIESIHAWVMEDTSKPDQQ